ncbi:MAG: A/G-specific adenine glycosylase [Candidatus Lokiarchaeota archaeon]|nr:A/G-specific adenine glycosylase [Candidatus Lokiarchaeota archaeon]
MYKSSGLTEDIIDNFRKIIYNYFKQFGRNFPFRNDINPYNVLISEIMLQQTQTNRVSQKFLEFIKKYPDFYSLANASNENILKIWQGLGYNRRALALKIIAKKVIEEYNDILPDSIDVLKTFPQIGNNTASSIVTFAYNKPTYFIETNIRRVYIYFFFPNKLKIDDKDIMEILKNTIDINNPRKWYYALMDYGVMLKKSHPELHKRSKHYKKQSKFKGSNRQIRGLIIKRLLEEKKMIKEELIKILGFSEKRTINIIKQLEDEGFLIIKDKEITISK